jgi:cystathionine beta-synthase
MNLGIIDEVIRVNDKECFLTTRELVRREGIYCGGSSGAAVAGAIKYAESITKKANIVVLLPDSAQKYLSKIFDDNWMRQNGFLEPDPIGTVADLIAAKSAGAVITADARDSVAAVITKMKAHGISRLPVVRDGKLIGVVAEIDVLRHMAEAGHTPEDAVEPLVEADFATVTPGTRIALITELFGQGGIIVVLEDDRILGVITKIDLIDYLSKRIPQHRGDA